MNGSDFRRWRTGFGLSQQDLADKMGVTRNTIQNWEAQSGDLSTIAANGVKIWDRRLRQEEPLRGPVTLIYADGPMMLPSHGPQRVAMMQQESHLSNAAVLCRVQMLASHPRFFNPFVMEGDRYDLWNMMELQRAIDGDDEQAPTLRNLLRRLATGIRSDAPNFVRSGPAMPTAQEQRKRERELIALAVQLERTADGHLQGILAESSTIESILAQTRALGLRPNDALVSAVAQAFHAARMPLPNGG
ncbi:MAG: helix-turn-helix transcriptional regulator [Alphaproteobacteria bacterium]|nr:helix-turn-helix transcriptional regulator [Alphaproteobacteria bacterium]